MRRIFSSLPNNAENRLPSLLPGAYVYRVEPAGERASWLSLPSERLRDTGPNPAIYPLVRVVSAREFLAQVQ